MADGPGIIAERLDAFIARWFGTELAEVLKAEGGARAGAASVVRAFHRRLCDVRVLDPACDAYEQHT